MADEQIDAELAPLLERLNQLSNIDDERIAFELSELLPLLLKLSRKPAAIEMLETKALEQPGGLLETIVPLLKGIAQGKPGLEKEFQRLAAKTAGSTSMTIPGFFPYEALREALAKNTFRLQADNPWPTAPLQEGKSQGHAQLIPALLDDQPLMPPEEIEKWSQLMWKQREDLSDLDADALDMLSHIWLEQAKNSDDYAVADVDDFLGMRGLKPKQGGEGRRGGYEIEQRTEMLKALSHIQNLWLNMGEVEILEDKPAKGRRPRNLKQGYQSRAFVITDRMGQIRLDGYLDVQRFAFRPGVLFARFLYGPGRQTALLSAKAVQYDPYRQKWEKRLARYLSWQWRVRARQGDYNRPYQVNAILEAVGESINQRYPSKTRERLEKALESLKEDEVISGWEYDQWDESAAEQRGWAEKWLQATILIVPPQAIKDLYRLTRRFVENGDKADFALTGATILSDLVKKQRKRRKLSQAEAAKELGISQSYLCKLERNQVDLSPEFRRKVEEWINSPARPESPGAAS